MLRDLRVGTKILIGFGTVICILLLISVISYFSLGGADRRFKVYQKLALINSFSGHLEAHLLKTRICARDFIISGSDEDLKAFESAFQTLVGMYRQGETLIKDSERMEKLKLIKASLDDYRSAFDEIIRLTKSRDDIGINRKDPNVALQNNDHIQNRMFSIGQIISDAAEAIRESATRDGEALGLQVSKNNARAVLFLIISSIISLIVAVIMALLISRQITGPVNQALGVVTRIAAGDLSGEFYTIKSDNEIAQLIGAMNQMVTNLKKQAAGLGEAVNVLSASTSEIVATTAQLASNASETAVSANETTTSIEEVRQTANVSSQKAKYVSDSAQKAAQIAKAGKKAVEDTREGMSSIKQKMESVAESIVTLSEQSQAIGEIIAAVDDLAEQTNILAVNAAIEAVKAGEQGKGFSVVAQEIKALADQSKQATKRVRAILNDIQKATGKAVMATEEGSKTVDAGARLSVQSGENIQALADAIAEAAQAAVQIAASSQQQLVGMDQVAEAMVNVKTASAQNAVGAKQTETATHNISELGDKLKELVSWYRITA